MWHKIIATASLASSGLIISSKPKQVIIGITSSSFDESMNQNEDLFFVMGSSEQIKTDQFLEKRLSDKEKELLALNFLEKERYKRKFILPFYIEVVKQLFVNSDEKPFDFSNFKNPHYFSYNQTDQELLAKLDDPEIRSIFMIENSSKRQREAFVYLIAELRKENIPVVVLQMPLNPLIKENIPLESLNLFDNYMLNLSEKFDFALVNLQDDFEREYFTDLTHLNSQGERIISEKIAKGDYDIIQ